VRCEILKTRDAAILALAVFLAVAITAPSSSPVFAQYAPCQPGYSYIGGSCYPGYSNYCPPGYANVGGTCYPPNPYNNPYGNPYNPYSNCQYGYYQNGYYYTSGSCYSPGYNNYYYSNSYYGNGYYRWHHRHW